MSLRPRKNKEEQRLKWQCLVKIKLQSSHLKEKTTWDRPEWALHRAPDNHFSRQAVKWLVDSLQEVLARVSMAIGAVGTRWTLPNPKWTRVCIRARPVWSLPEEWCQWVIRGFQVVISLPSTMLTIQFQVWRKPTGGDPRTCYQLLRAWIWIVLDNCSLASTLEVVLESVWEWAHHSRWITSSIQDLAEPHNRSHQLTKIRASLRLRVQEEQDTIAAEVPLLDQYLILQHMNLQVDRENVLREEPSEIF